MKLKNEARNKKYLIAKTFDSENGKEELKKILKDLDEDKKYQIEEIKIKCFQSISDKILAEAVFENLKNNFLRIEKGRAKINQKGKSLINSPF